MTFETVIGLEIHAQLSTKSKLFSNSSTKFGAPANTTTSFIDAGLPGTLPVLNKEAVLLALKFGVAINAELNDLSYFERKNYFYPDLPKGYQISQHKRPIIGAGTIKVDDKIVQIHHAHLEEDAGKSIHNAPHNYTSIDLNRAGNPLLEIVTEPCMHSSDEVVSFLKYLHRLLRFLEICDGNMQEGSFRCDINLSLRKKGTKKLGVRTELKNLNSFRFIEKAIKIEELRHQELLESGQEIVQQTRLYCPETNTTHPIREKEDENDYRYFVDPDLLPIKICEKDLKNIKENLPTLPDAIKSSLLKNDNLTDEDVDFLLSSKHHVNFYQEVKKHSKANNKMIVNWLKGVYTAYLHENNLSFQSPPVSAKNLGELLNKLTDDVIQTTIAKQIFAKLTSSDLSVAEIMLNENYETMHDEETLVAIIKEIIAKHPEQVSQYKAGKTKVFGFFVGIIMKETNNLASANDINRLLKKLI